MSITNNENRITIYEGSIKPLLPDFKECSIVFSRCKGACGFDAGKDRVAIKAVFNGEENYNVDSETVKVSAGRMLLLNNDQGCNYDFFTQQATEGICIRLASPLIEEVHRVNFQSTNGDLVFSDEDFHNAPNFFPGVSLMQDGSLGRYLLDLYGAKESFEHQQQSDMSETTFYNLADQLLQNALDVRTRINHLQGKKQSTKQELYKRLQHAKLLMHDHIQHPLKTGAIAAEVGLSEYYFYRIFKEVFQITPQQYYTSLRLQRAKELVKITNLSLTEIACRAGYADLSIFSKSFRLKYGVSPSQLKDKA